MKLQKKKAKNTKDKTLKTQTKEKIIKYFEFNFL